MNMSENTITIYFFRLPIFRNRKNYNTVTSFMTEVPSI